MIRISPCLRTPEILKHLKSAHFSPKNGCFSVFYGSQSHAFSCKHETHDLLTLVSYMMYERLFIDKELGGEDMEQERELVLRARAGDVEAFARLYEEIYRDLYRFALYTLKNTHDAEDAVSDTVADAWQGIRGLRRTEAFRAWMFRILTNKCRRRLGQYANKALSLPEDLAEEPRDIGRNIDVRRAFAALSDEERMILALNIFGGYTSREIGRLLHMSNNTVRSKQSRALKKMEARLER